MSAKQVIVVRRELKMRRGKEIAQGSHACMKDLLAKFVAGKTIADLDAAEQQYYLGIFIKICVSVNSEAELLAIYDAAKAAGLRVHLIEDNGLTEFHGVFTKTCLAIGPHFDEEIDPITRHLPLY